MTNVNDIFTSPSDIQNFKLSGELLCFSNAGNETTIYFWFSQRLKSYCTTVNGKIETIQRFGTACKRVNVLIKTHNLILIP